MVFEFVFKH